MKQLEKIDKFIIKYAHWIDNLDFYLGPLAESARMSSSSFMNEVGIWSNIVQYGVLKLPFIAIYLTRTKDFDALSNWIPRETFALGVPYGELTEVMRNYEKTVHKFYEI